jgi:hypothetical protein
MKLSRVLFAVVLCAAAFRSAGADTLITANKHMDAIPMAQKPAMDEVQKTWLAKDKIRMDGKDSGVLIRMDKKTMYVLDHAKKKASSVDLPIDFSKLVPPEMATQMQGMLSAMKMTAKLTPTDETKKVGSWSARRYNLEMSSPMGMKIDMVLWATKDIKIDMALYKDLMVNMQSLNPTMADMAKEFGKIDGVAVITEMTMNMMGNAIKSRDEITSVEEKAAPADTYELPAGYAVEKFDLTKQMGGAHGGGAK